MRKYMGNADVNGTHYLHCTRDRKPHTNTYKSSAANKTKQRFGFITNYEYNSSFSQPFIPLCICLQVMILITGAIYSITAVMSRRSSGSNSAVFHLVVNSIWCY